MADVQLTPADLVDTATHELLNGQPDWGKNMQIIDLVNTQRHAGPVVLAALRKRLNHRNHSVGLTSVALLEALVKNCPAIVPLVADEEFLNELVHTLPRQVRDPHNKGIFSGLRDHARDILAVERYDKTLLCIESWGKTWSPESEAVRRDRRLSTFAETYRALQRAGVHFPAPERDELAPVLTPAASAAQAKAAQQRAEQQRAEQQRAEQQRRHQDELAAAEHARQQPRAPAAPVFHFTDPDLASAVETCNLLADLLTQSSPSEDLRRNELVQQILEALRPLAAKISQRLSAEAHAPQPREKLLAELLQANEICVDTASYYESLLKGGKRRVVAPPPSQPRSSAASASSSLPAAAAHAPAPSSAEKMSHKPSTDKKPVAVPLLQPPPASSSSRKSSSAAAATSPVRAPAAAPAPAGRSSAAAPSSSSSSSVDLFNLDFLSTPAAAPAHAASASPAYAAPAAAPLDLFSFEPSQPPARSQQQHQMPAQQQQHQQHMQPPPYAATTSGGPGGETSGGTVPVPVYEQQQALMRRAQEQRMQQQQPLASSSVAAHSSAAAAAAPRSAITSPSKSSFVLAPPPAAGSAFFVASPTSASSKRTTHAAPSRAPPAPVESTPFDSPDPVNPNADNDPFAALAMRSPDKKSIVDDFAGFKF